MSLYPPILLVQQMYAIRWWFRKTFAKQCKNRIESGDLRDLAINSPPSERSAAITSRTRPPHSLTPAMTHLPQYNTFNVIMKSSFHPYRYRVSVSLLLSCSPSASEICSSRCLFRNAVTSMNNSIDAAELEGGRHVLTVSFLSKIRGGMMYAKFITSNRFPGAPSFSYVHDFHRF